MYTLDLSIILPSYNEEKSIIKTLNKLTKSLQINKIKKYELIFVDDGSTDKTKKIINEYIFSNKKKISTKKLFLKKNLGLGGAFRNGVNLSKGKNVIFIPTDDSHPIKGLSTIFKKFKKMDRNKILISYVKNKKARSPLRRFISFFYTEILNIIFQTKIKYFNGLNIYPLKKLKNNLNITNSFSFQTEILIMMIKKGVKYEYVKTFISERKIGGTNAFKIKNIFLVGTSILKLIYKYYAK